MPALVLTAGLGTRLDPLTRLVAKPAMPLAEQTLIEQVLAWLRSQNVGKVVLNLHHLPETVTRVVGDGAHLGLSVRYSWESPILGSAGGPRRALSLLDHDKFLIVNGDTLCAVDVRALVREHEVSGAHATLAVVPNPDPDRYNGIVADSERRITGFVPKGRAADSWHFVGIQVVNASVFSHLEDGVPAETVAGLYREHVSSGAGNLRIFPVNVPFFDVGTACDYLTTALTMARSANSIQPGSRISQSARISQSVIWSESSVGSNVELHRCVVAGVDVPAGFQAQDALLVPSAVVRSTDSAIVTNGIAKFRLAANTLH